MKGTKTETVRVTLNPQNPILIVAQMASTIKTVTGVLRRYGLNNLIPCQQASMVMNHFSSLKIATVLLGNLMIYDDGDNMLSTINRQYPDTPIIVLDEKIDGDSMLKSMDIGAFDCISTPVDHGRLFSAVTRALESANLMNENMALKKHLLSDGIENPEVFSKIVARDRKMMSIFRYLESVSPTLNPVLVTGEAGVGKKLLATVIHRLSELKGKMIAVDLSDADDGIFMEKMFRIKDGTIRCGAMDLAGGGTLFLDGIGKLPEKSQETLLKILRKGKFAYPEFNTLKYKTSRIVVSHSGTLADLEESGNMREDLLRRLCAYHVHVPPLRERMDDIPPLVDHFIGIAMEELKRRVKKPPVPTNLFSLLAGYHFNGNVAELRDMVFEAVKQHKSGKLSIGTFKKHIGNVAPDVLSADVADRKMSSPFSDLNELPTIKEATQMLILEAMKRADKNQSVAAGLLGITQPALSYHLKKTGLNSRDGESG